MKTRRVAGFTLIELLIVIAIIGLLAAALTVNFAQSRAESRDAERQADLRSLQAALEAYKNRNGQYPAQCTPANAGTAQGWSGQLGTDFRCSDGTGQYIVGLAPEYIPVLPADPKLNGSNSGYVYRTNAERSVYKVMAMNTVESETLNTNAAYGHDFRSCPIQPRVQADGRVDNFLMQQSICGSIWDSVGGGAVTPADCRVTSSRFQKSYGVWGGFDTTSSTLAFPISTNAQKQALQPTTDVLCK